MALYVPQVSARLGTGPVAIEMLALAALGAPVLFLVDLARKRVSAMRSAATIEADPRPPSPPARAGDPRV